MGTEEGLHVSAYRIAARPAHPSPTGARHRGLYCSAWRSLPELHADPDRLNEILSKFQVRPRVFNEENGHRRRYAKVRIEAWLGAVAEQIDAIDATFRFKIQQAHANRSKSLLPLIRDRVMFHVAIHFCAARHRTP